MNPIRAFKILRAIWLLSQNPNRLEQVFAIADTGADRKVLQEIARTLEKDPQAARALREATRVTGLDLDALRGLPPGTLGREFADHMTANGLDPKAIPVPSHAGGDVRYIKTHLRETHDIWHVVTGFGTDVAGEIGLQAFYLAQLPSRLAGALIGMAFLHVATKNIDAREAIMTEVVRGWAMGKRAKTFFGFDWSRNWATPLAEVRAQLDVATDATEAKLPPAMTYVFDPAASAAPARRRTRVATTTTAEAGLAPGE